MLPCWYLFQVLANCTLTSKRTSSDDDGSSFAEHRKVKLGTFQKWLMDNNCEYKTLTWLDSDTSWENGYKVAEKLKCKVCKKYKERIICKKNFSGKWIEGADSVRMTNLVDHAKSD